MHKQASVKSSKNVILLLLVMFFGPMIAAWIIYNHGHVSDTTVNSGKLLQPPMDFTQLRLLNADGSTFNITPFQHHWVMMYFVPKSCNAVCEKNLYNMRQVRLAVGKDRERVERLIVTDKPTSSMLGSLLTKEYPGTYNAVTKRRVIENFIARSNSKPIALQNGSLYLVDPLGNVMMAYGPEVVPKGLLKDLTRLLNVSQIG